MKNLKTPVQVLNVEQAYFSVFNVKIQTILFFILFMIANLSSRSNPSLEWAFSMPNPVPGGNVIGLDVKADNAGNVYVVGTFEGKADFDPGTGEAYLISAGMTDIFVAKYNSSGNYVFAFSLGGTQSDFVYSLALDASDNIYVGGYFNGSVDFDPGSGTHILTAVGPSDIFVAKYNSSGNLLFANRIGGSGGEGVRAVTLDGSGNIILTGSFEGTVDFDPGPAVSNLTSSGFTDAFVAKYTSSGDFLFAFAVGGSNNDEGYSVAVDASGNIYITGYFSSTVDFDPGPSVANLTGVGWQDVFFAKYNSSGSYLFAGSLGGLSSLLLATSIAVDGSENIYLTGYFWGTVDFNPGPGVNTLSSVGSYDAFFARYNSSGNYVFAHALGSTFDDVGSSIKIDASGNIYVTGYFRQTVDFNPGPGIANLTSAGSGDIFIAKYNSSGNYLSARNIGGIDFDQGNSIFLDSSGNIYITGQFRNIVDFDPGPGIANLTSTEFYNAYIAKYTSSETYLWAIQLGNYQIPLFANDDGTHLAIDNSGNVYLTGYFTAVADFDPGPGTVNLVPAGSSDIFVAKYSPTGNLLWAFNVGGTLDDLGYGIAVDNAGNVYITGAFSGIADFDPGAGTFLLTSAGDLDIFFAKYNSSGGLIYARRVGGTLTDVSNSLAIDASGNVFLTGSFAGTADFDPGPGTFNLTSAGSSDLFFARYDASGNFVFARSIGGTQYEVGHSISLDPYDNILLTGSFEGTVDFDPGPGTTNLVSAGLNDVFIAKYNSAGNYLSAIGLGSTEADIGYSLTVDNSGNVYVTGIFSGNVDFDPGPSSALLTSAGTFDIFFARYNTSLNYDFAQKIGGTGYDFGNQIVLDGSGKIYLTGYFSDVVDFDPGSGVENLTSNGSYDIFVANYTNSGNYINAFALGGPLTDIGNAIIVDNFENIYISGRFLNGVDFDPGSGIHTLTAQNGFDIYLAKFSEGIQITTQPISPSQLCNGEEVIVWYTVSTPLNPGNVFTAQLSDATGSFASPVNIGTKTSTTSGYIGAVIPINTPPGSGYRIRVISSDPVVIGSDNGHPITVLNCCTNPTDGGVIASSQTICYGSSPSPFTSVTLPSGYTGTLEYQWQKSTLSAFSGFNDIAGATSAVFTETASLTQTTWYRRLARVICDPIPWSMAVASNVIQITVLAEFTTGEIDATGETICFGGDPGMIGNITFASGGDGNISYIWESSTDAAFTSPMVINHNSPVYDPPAGLTVTTWYRRLAKDNTCISTFQPSTGVWKVTVEEDLSVICPSNFIVNTDPGNCSALVSFTATFTGTPTPAITYAIDGIIPITSPYAFPVGTTQIKVTASNYCETEECWFQVIVSDNELPNVQTKNITIYLDSNGQASITPADVDDGSTDNCGIATLSLDITQFDCTNAGPNIVTLTVNDVHGNSASQTATVTVVDNLPPVVVTQNITVYLDSNGQATITPANIDNGSTDNCGIASYNLDITQFDCTNAGPNIVTLTVTDVHGNSASQTATVTVVDNLPPVVVTQNITVYLDSNGQATITPNDVDNGSHDNCGIASLSLNIFQFYCSNIGANTIVLTATDVHGNSSGQTATVYVVDAIPPQIVGLPAGITVYNDPGQCGAVVSWVEPSVSDNCPGANISMIAGLPNGSFFPVGTHTILYQAIDASLNLTNGSFVITVIDNEPPVVITQNITIQLDQYGNATITPLQVNNGSWDNCGIASFSLSQTAFNTSHIGNNLVTLTVTDIHGNVSSGIAIVTVDQLPAPWKKCNTHSSANGSSSYNFHPTNPVFYLEASGTSSLNNDVHHFVYQDICFPVFTIIARVVNVQNHAWAGVMVRENCSPSARTILYKTRHHNPQNIVGRRLQPFSNMINTSHVAQMVTWMKIQRNGNQFNIFISYNGVNWFQVFGGTITMSSCVQVGMFVEASLPNTTAKAWFDKVEIVNFLKQGIVKEDVTSGNPVESSEMEMTVYPNPANDILFIQFNHDPGSFRWVVMDLNGHEIRSGFSESSLSMVVLQGLSKGIYILRVENNSSTFTKRIVIQ